VPRVGPILLFLMSLSTAVKEDESGSGGFYGRSCRAALAEAQESTDDRKIFPMGCRVHSAVL
jgi:hypothetical protein